MEGVEQSHLVKQMVALANNGSSSSLKYLHGKREFVTYRNSALAWLLLKFVSAVIHHILERSVFIFVPFRVVRLILVYL
jgi:hypothetical protein